MANAPRNKVGCGCLVLIGLFILILVGVGLETHGIGTAVILLILGVALIRERGKIGKRKESGVVQAKVRAAQEQMRLQQASERQILGGLMGLSPLQFEQAVGLLLSGMGYADVQHVGGSGDRGADLTAIDSFGRFVVIQCKRYAESNKVGSPEIQRFVGAINIHGAHHGIVVTTSGFTSEARSIASGHRIELVDGKQLRQWVDEYNQRNGG